jgi:hypothetical protein
MDGWDALAGFLGLVEEAGEGGGAVGGACGCCRRCRFSKRKPTIRIGGGFGGEGVDLGDVFRRHFGGAGGSLVSGQCAFSHSEFFEGLDVVEEGEGVGFAGEEVLVGGDGA